MVVVDDAGTRQTTMIDSIVYSSDEQVFVGSVPDSGDEDEAAGPESWKGIY